MTDGLDGYPLDHAYTNNAAEEMAPAHLRALTILRERMPAPLDRPFRYLDLGCGTGFGTVLLAAANPAGTFVGIDAAPEHVLSARALAEEAEIPNVAFREASFADLLAEPDGLGSFDVIALHGVYTWVSPENRARIVEILRRHLATGGLAYLAYNAMPGGGMIAALRRMIHRRVEGDRAADPAGAVEDTIALFRELADEDPPRGLFAAVPALGNWIERFGRGSARYRHHEFLPEHADAIWHDDLARDLAAARLSYLGSARLLENFDALCLPERHVARLAEADLAGHGEMLRDVLANRMFRGDVFARGAPRAPRGMLEPAYASLAIGLVAPPADPPAISTPAGSRRLNEAHVRPLLDRLRDGPATLAALEETAASAGIARKPARQAINALVIGNVARPAASVAPCEAALAACERFNRLVLARIDDGVPMPSLASPHLGGPVRIDRPAARCLGIPTGDAETGPEPDLRPPAGTEADQAAKPEAIGDLEARHALLVSLGIEMPSARS